MALRPRRQNLRVLNQVSVERIKIPLSPEGVPPKGMQASDKFIMGMAMLTLEEREKLLEHVKANEERTTNNIQRLTGLLAKRGARAARLREEADRAEAKYQRTNAQLMDEIAAQASAMNAEKFVSDCVHLSKRTIEELNERVGTDYYQNVAKLLNVYYRFIDPAIPIQVSTQSVPPRILYNRRTKRVAQGETPNDTLSLSFGVKDLRIRTTNGNWVDYSFGDFAVTIFMKGWRSFQVIEVRMVPSGMRAHKVGAINGIYYHPHVKRNGSVCVGNSGIEMMKAANDRNYMTAIYIFFDTITMYNPKSPYEKLIGWVPNTDDLPLCGCGDKTVLDCDKPMCPMCNAHVQEDAQTCGCCPVCCMNNHVWLPDNLIMKRGINRSGCEHRTRP